MSSIRLFTTRLKRFRRTGEVGLFEPTPLNEIDKRHHRNLPFYQPSLYIPGELLVTKAARREADAALKSLNVEYHVRDVGTSGLARLQVFARNIPDLALEVELRVRGSRQRRTTDAALASEGSQEYGSRTDEAIRIRLDEMARRENESTLVSPNHCFTPTPVCGVGPADEPKPAAPIPAPKGSAGTGVRIAIIDTGIFKDVSHHPWLANDVHYSCSDLEPPDGDGDGMIDAVSGHGHFVAGIVRTEAPGATIFVERLFHNGRFINEWQLNQKLHEVLDADPHIINLSLTGQTIHGGPPAGLADVWKKLRSKKPEIVVVASAGNAGVNHEFWPGALKEVVAVGALDEKYELPGPHPDDFSNYGHWVDVYARGVRVVNAFTTGRLKYELSRGTATFESPFCTWSGTSFSAPLVTGRIAARMTSTTPNLDAAQARDRVIADARATSLAPPGPKLAPDGSPIYIVR